MDNEHDINLHMKIILPKDSSRYDYLLVKPVTDIIEISLDHNFYLKIRHDKNFWSNKAKIFLHTSKVKFNYFLEYTKYNPLILYRYLECLLLKYDKKFYESVELSFFDSINNGNLLDVYMLTYCSYCTNNNVCEFCDSYIDPSDYKDFLIKNRNNHNNKAIQLLLLDNRVYPN